MPGEYEHSSSKIGAFRWVPIKKIVILSKMAQMILIQFILFKETTSLNKTSQLVPSRKQ